MMSTLYTTPHSYLENKQVIRGNETRLPNATPSKLQFPVLWYYLCEHLVILPCFLSNKVTLLPGVTL